MDAEADADAALAFLAFFAFLAGLEASVDAAAAAEAAGADAFAEGADAWAKAVEANRPTTRAAINFFILVSFIKYWLRVIQLNQGK
ncbi:hypothetical protein ACO0LC_11750 [Undibacterium sp. JH2W]|uniref:hypothetical protein n=2 Tax=Undibacterium TaxID=401469 RepID=UPI003BEFC56B